MRFDRLQPAPPVVRRLRPRTARRLFVHGHGSRERGNAFADGTPTPQSVAEEGDGDVGTGGAALAVPSSLGIFRAEKARDMTA